MSDDINGSTVYVCEQRDQNPKLARQGKRQWFTVGVVADREDAEEWAERDPDNRAWSKQHIGLVENLYGTSDPV